MDKLQDIACTVDGTVFKAEANNSCYGCAGGNNAYLCKKLGTCSEYSHYQNSPSIIWVINND